VEQQVAAAGAPVLVIGKLILSLLQDSMRSHDEHLDQHEVAVWLWEEKKTYSAIVFQMLAVTCHPAVLSAIGLLFHDQSLLSL
jgi:hypothetical protein